MLAKKAKVVYYILHNLCLIFLVQVALAIWGMDRYSRDKGFYAQCLVTCTFLSSAVMWKAFFMYFYPDPKNNS